MHANQIIDKHHLIHENLMSIDLSKLHLAPHKYLSECTRQTCASCNKSCSFYCCDCCISLSNFTPSVRLPVQVDIIQHGETNAKGTGIHAALIAPDCVTLHRHIGGSGHHRRKDPLSLQLPAFDVENTVVLFPESKDTDVVGQCTSFQRVVVLDGSWRKARAMLSHPTLRQLRRVQLPLDVRTAFWRRGAGEFRGAVDQGVSTIESIHALCAALDPTAAQQGHYDNLLWYFTYIHGLVEQRGGPPRTRTKQRPPPREAEGGMLEAGAAPSQ